MNAASSSADCQYVWGQRYVDDLVLRDRDSDGNSGTGSLGKSGSGLDERLYALQDPNYNVVALAETDGDIVTRYRYTAYGAPTPLDPDFTPYTGADYAWPYLYTTRRQDPETNLMHYRNRYYHTGMGRFISRDPISYEAKDFSLYRYVRNSATNATDPSGLIGMLEPPIDSTGGWEPCPENRETLDRLRDMDAREVGPAVPAAPLAVPGV